jgi:hypothetical protein
VAVAAVVAAIAALLNTDVKHIVEHRIDATIIFNFAFIILSSP